MSTSSYICFSGAPRKRLYTEKEFVNAMKKMFPKAGPKTVNEWIKYSGAIRSSKQRCNQMGEGNKLVRNASYKMSTAEETLKKCAAVKCKNLYNLFAESKIRNQDEKAVVGSYIAVAPCAISKCATRAKHLANKSIDLKKVMKEVGKLEKPERKNKSVKKN